MTDSTTAHALHFSERGNSKIKDRRPVCSMIITHRRPDNRWFSHIHTRESWTRLYSWELLKSSCSSMHKIITRCIDFFLMKCSISNTVISCPVKLREAAASCARTRVTVSVSEWCLIVKFAFHHLQCRSSIYRKLPFDLSTWTSRKICR